MQKTIAQTLTNYQQIGKGFPVILLHGWGCDWQIWSPIIPDLSDEYQLIVPDLPVFGLSDIKGQVWDSFAYAEWLREFIQEVVGDQPFILGGHSFGGKIAAIYASKYSSPQLRGLVIIDASGLPEQLTPKEQITQTVAKLVPQSLKDALGTSLKKTILNKLEVATDYQEADPVQQAILREIVREDISHELSQIDTPSLVMWGAKDDATPLAKGELFAELIQGAELIVFNESGHYPYVDETKPFIRSLSKFINQHKK